MKFQIYLSGSVQKHFGLAAKDVPHNSDVEPEGDWWARWRFEFVLSAGGGSQHVFLATNEESYYSFVLLLDDGKGIGGLVSRFLDHWFDALSRRGVAVDEKLIHETLFLRGQQRKLIGVMKEMVSLVGECAINGEGVEKMHLVIRNIYKTKGDGYILPHDEFKRLLAAEPPPQMSDGGASNVVPFPST
ncbi:MAG: hypothetical protein ACI9MB_000882 [Verrucomicrobiales bacterium]|mgnify:CR=1 FL=1|jgi:hypothetical protein